MIVSIKNKSGIKKAKIKLALLQKTKAFDPYKYLGKIRWQEDALTYQKNLRNEW